MKKALALILALCMMAALCACGTTAVKEPSETVEAAAADETAGTVDGAAKPDGYPNGTISWIVTSSAGGAIDLFTRALADVAELGGNIVVENIKGGSQSIGTTEAVTRPADGQTLCSMATTGLITMPLTTEVAYSVEDFRYIAKIAPDCYGTVVTKAGSELDTADELFELISDKNAKYTIGVSSIGGHSYIEIAHAMMQLGTFNHDRFVVYDGSNGVLQALLSGEVDFALLDDNYITSYVSNGDINAVMVCYSDRSALHPDVPCLGEYGITGLEPLVGFKILAIRKDTPADIVDWIKQQINEAIMSETYQKFLSEAGVGTISAVSTEEELNEMVNGARENWDKVLIEAGIK